MATSFGRMAAGTCSVLMRVKRGEFRSPLAVTGGAAGSSNGATRFPSALLGFSATTVVLGIGGSCSAIAYSTSALIHDAVRKEMDSSHAKLEKVGVDLELLLSTVQQNHDILVKNLDGLADQIKGIRKD